MVRGAVNDLAGEHLADPVQERQVCEDLLSLKVLQWLSELVDDILDLLEGLLAATHQTREALAEEGPEL